MLNSGAEDPGSADRRMDKYVARCARWDWHDGSQIDILDRDDHIAKTLDPIQTWIFHEADGGRTVRNLLSWSAAHYQGEQPKPTDLDATNLKSLAELVNDLRVVTLIDEPPVLPDYLLFPWSKQNHEVSRRLMKEDGYVG